MILSSLPKWMKVSSKPFQYVPFINITMRCLGEGKRRGFWLPLSRYPSRLAALAYVPRTDGQRSLAPFSLSSSVFLRRSLARFMIARRHHDHRLQMRRRRRRSWRTSGESRVRKASTDSIHPRSVLLALCRRGSSQPFSAHQRIEEALLHSPVRRRRRPRSWPTALARARPPRKVEPLRGRVNPR